MGRLGPVVRMVAQRSVGHGRLFLAMAAGAVLAAALMACVVIYSDAIRDLGLDYALRSQPDRELDFQVVSSSQAFGGNEYAVRKSTTDNLLHQQAINVLSNTVHYGRTSTFYLAQSGMPVPTEDSRPRAHFQFSDDLADHVRLVEGRAPEPPVFNSADNAPTIEVWAGLAAAQQHGFGVGATFDLFPHWREDLSPVHVVVVGLIEPNDIDEPYWFGKTDRFTVDTKSWPTYPFFSDEATLTGALPRYIDDLDGMFETYGYIDTGKVDASNADDVEARVRGLQSAVSAQIQYSYLQTTLADTIARYQEQLFFTRVPLFALMLQVVGIALFYLVMVSTAVVDRQSGEIALMRSRGASSGQVLAVFALEGLGICLIALVLGPLLAMLAIAVLGYTPPFEELSGGSLLEVSLSPFAFGLAAFGALLAFLALIWPAWRASRHSMTHHRQQLSRPDQQPAFLRYYLDLVLIGVGALLFYQLRQRGSFVTESVFGDLSADPLLLATPTLFMLMAALVFLRLFPLLLRLVIWLARGLKGPTVSLGLTRMARAPVQHSRLILLLILTTAVGMFAAGFRSTLERGYEDRAAYRAGSELRLADIREPLNVSRPDFEKVIGNVAGNRVLAEAVRMDGTYNISRLESESVTLLGADLEQLAKVSDWRDDFASHSLDDLLRSAKYEAAPPAVAAMVPPGSKWIGVWAQLSLRPGQGAIGVRLVDARGGFWEYRLAPTSPGNPGDQPAGPGAPPPDGAAWTFFAADLNRPTGRPGSIEGAAASTALVDQLFSGTNGQSVPVAVDAVYVNLMGNQPQGIESHSAVFDDLLALTDAPALDEAGTGLTNPSTQVESFDELARYELIRGASLTGEPGGFNRADGRAGEGGAIRLAFIRGRGSVPVAGIRLAADPAPLPIIASKKFLDGQDKKVGDEFVLYVNRQYVDVKVVGQFKYFPTFDPAKDDPLLIADLEGVRARAARLPVFGGGAYPNEAWLGPGTGTLTKEGLQEQGMRVEQVFDRAAILAEQRSDPLVAASWEGILFLSFAAVLLLSGLGFVIYSGLSARARSLEFAILRTMGLSGRQILGVVSFEQLFVILSGVAAGTLLGFPLSRLMIGYMGLTEHGEDPLPPLLSSVSWQAVLTVYTLLGIVVASTVASLVVLYSRVAVSRALRMGDL